MIIWNNTQKSKPHIHYLYTLQLPSGIWWNEMKFDSRCSAVFIILGFLIQSAYGMQITATGGGNGESGTLAMNFDTLKASSVNSEGTINGADITPKTVMSGPIPRFEETHGITDATGKSASVYVKVMNAPGGLTYTSTVLPPASAEQWLTVTKADSIKCTATSSYGTTRSANVGLEEYKGTAAGDYVTLTGYYGKALTTGTYVLASQSASIGIGSTIKLYGSATDTSGLYSVNTQFDGLSVNTGGKTIKGKASFTGLAGSSSAGSTTTTQAVQSEHVHGLFTSTTRADTQTKTRTSSYGSDYDLSVGGTQSSIGPVAYGIVGYYVTPFLKIQRAVNAAESGDTINIAAWTFKENVRIDKSLTLIGAGARSTIVDGNKKGSVFTIGSTNPNIDVTLSGLKIQNGKASYGGGIGNMGKLTLIDSTLSGNSATSSGGGFYNAGNLFVGGTSQIVNNQAAAGNGGGIHSEGSLTLCGTKVTVKNNRARLPDPLLPGAPWYQQYGVFMTSGVPTTPYGFNPDTQVTGNIKI
jgi:hypothetical protein